MGFLDAGDTFDWEEAQELSLYVRRHGILQFLSIYDAKKDQTDSLKWGDEVRGGDLLISSTVEGR